MIKNWKDCIDLIERQKAILETSEQNIEELLTEIRPYINKKYGSNLMIQIEKLIREELFDHAIKILNDLPKKYISFKFRSKLSKWFFFILLFGSGMSFAIIGGIDILNSKSSTDWPSVKAVITKSRIDKSMTIRNSSITNQYNAFIEYEYTINSTEYISDRVCYCENNDQGSLLKKYPVGTVVEVFYKPNNPKVSVLEPGYSSFPFMWIGGAVLFFFLSVLFFRIDNQKD